MNLEQHFKRHVNTNIQQGRDDITDSILSDPEAVAQLEDDDQLFLDINMEQLAARLRDYAAVERTNPPSYEQQKLIIESQVGAMVIDLFMKALRADIDARYNDVDLEQLARDEHEPYDSTDVGSAA